MIWICVFIGIIIAVIGIIRELLKEQQTQVFEITKPDGATVLVTNIEAFCAENKLSNYEMWMAFYNNQSYMGYTMKLVS